MPGLTSKKLAGLRKKEACSTGMHGQSSQRGMCVTPIVCHSTRSTPSRDRFCMTMAHTCQRQLSTVPNNLAAQIMLTVLKRCSRPC